VSKHIVFLLIAASITSLAWADSDIRVLNGDAHFPQGPVWYRGRLYYVEYDRNTVRVSRAAVHTLRIMPPSIRTMPPVM
jgi:hypothetical protein